MRLDIGMYHVGKVSRYSTKYLFPQPSSIKFFTVDDMDDKIHVYEHPAGASKQDIKHAIHMAYIEPYDYDSGPEGRRVGGRYPNYHIEEIV